MLSSAGGYWLCEFGRYRGGFDEGIVQQKIDRLKQGMEHLKQEIKNLRDRNRLLVEQNAMLDRFSRIDRNAHDEVKFILKEAQQQSLELREELAFYRSLVSPSEMKPGLHIQSFTVESGVNPSAFNYKLVLTQLRENQRDAVGMLSLHFSGFLGDEAVVYTLSDVDGVKTDNLNFKFRYFQSLEGDVHFPALFVPKSITIMAKPKGGHLKSVKKTLKWDTALTRSYE